MATGEQFLNKPLPSATDAERIILGAILLSDAVLPQAIEQLAPADFYSPNHRRIYAAMLELFKRRESIDPILIGEELKKDGSLDSIGGVATITNLTYGLPHFENITDYVKLVREKKKIRDLIKICGTITSTALAEDDLAENVLSFAQTSINEVCTDEDKKGFRVLGAIATERIIKTNDLRENGVMFTGLRTGLRDWDAITGGLQKTDLIIVAGRPGMGKSSLVANIAERACFLEKEAVVAVFSLEMSKEQYTDRMLCSSAKVDLTRYRNGHLTKDEFERLAFTADTFHDYKIHIDDSSSLTPLELRSKLMRLEAENKRIDLVAVDYLQRMTSSKRSESRQQEISQIARELKSIAKDFAVPVVAVSSLSRAVEARNPPRPKMSDLRESGDIESEADIVALIYRDEYYRQAEDNAGIAELIMDKHRHGATGVVKLTFLKEYTCFANYFEE